jgi:hypothetical protein
VSIRCLLPAARGPQVTPSSSRTGDRVEDESKSQRSLAVLIADKATPSERNALTCLIHEGSGSVVASVA